MKKTLTPKAPKTSPAGDPAPAAAPRFTPRGGSKNRILIAVQDNKIDFSAMSSEAAKTFNELMHNPEVQAQFNIGPLRDRFDPEHCKEIYTAIGFLLYGFGKFAMKFPAPALGVLIYTAEEKEQLAEPTAKVLDEIAPKWLRENQAFAALALVFGTITQNKLAAAAMIAAEIKKAKEAGISAPPNKAEQQRAAGLRSVPVPEPAPAPAAPAPPAPAPRRTIIEAAAPAQPESVTLGPTGGPSL